MWAWKSIPHWGSEINPHGKLAKRFATGAKGCRELAWRNTSLGSTNWNLPQLNEKQKNSNVPIFLNLSTIVFRLRADRPL